MKVLPFCWKITFRAAGIDTQHGSGVDGEGGG